MELAKNLIRICKKKHLSLPDLARLSGVKRLTLYRWTTGKTVRNLDDLKKVCAILKVGIHEILFSEPDLFENEGFIEEFIWGNLRITLHKVRKGNKKLS